MILTTTDAVEGKSIKEYLGVVTGCDRGNGAVAIAISNMEKRAAKLGADAVIGIRVLTWGFSRASGNDRACADAIGTAVKLGQPTTEWM